MPRFIVAYYGGPKFETPQQRTAYMAKWRAWMARLGESLVDPGTPLGMGKLVSTGGLSDSGADFLSGLSTVTANNLDGALRLVQDCPHLEHGTIEVAEMMDIRMT
jgi:hypothetical protein